MTVAFGTFHLLTRKHRCSDLVLGVFEHHWPCLKRTLVLSVFEYSAFSSIIGPV